MKYEGFKFGHRGTHIGAMLTYPTCARRHLLFQSASTALPVFIQVMIVGAGRDLIAHACVS